MGNKRVAALGRGVVTGLMLLNAWPLLAQTGVPSEQQRSDSQSARTANTAVSATEKGRAESWDLNNEQWQRYRSLLQGIRGSISPSSLSPIEVLGIHARNGAERRRYAEQWAMMMREDAERILAFQHAYDEAQQRLFPQGQLIDAVQLAMHRRNTQTGTDAALGLTDRVLFFTATDCAACDVLLDRLLGKLSAISGIDVYLLDVMQGDEDRIRAWAGKRRIDPDWVRDRRVTLNVNAGALEKLADRLGVPLGQRPVVLRRRGDAVAPLSSARF